MLNLGGLRLRLPSEMVEVHDHRLKQRDIRLLLKREDLIHTELTGNKWRKLKYNLIRATEQGQSTLLTLAGCSVRPATPATDREVTEQTWHTSGSSTGGCRSCTSST